MTVDANLTQVRERVIDGLCLRYQRQGWLVAGKTGISAQLVKPKIFSVVWAFLWLLLFGAGIIVYLIYYMAKRPKTMLIELASDADDRPVSVWCDFDRRRIEVAPVFKARIAGRWATCGLCPTCGAAACSF
jgi:hypothetical protein